MGAIFSASIFKLLFLLCFAVGAAGLVLCNSGKIQMNLVVATILVYFLIFVFLVAFGVDQASAHIRVSFIFWATGILYFGILNERQKIHIGRFLIAIFAITCVTSALGVIVDNDAARSITYTLTDDTLQTNYKLRNIASIYLFQCLTLFIPLIVWFSKNRRKKLLPILLIVLVFFTLLNASFTIALIIGLVSLILSMAFLKIKRSTIIYAAILAVIMGILAYNGSAILGWLAGAIPNERIAERVTSIRDLLYFNQQNNMATGRFDLYRVSFTTFLENPLGVGAFYAYKTYDNGIGYHSQLLDDLARYGLGAIAFYACFLAGYHNHLRNEWKKLGYPNVATITVILYLLLLIFNLGFRSAEESVVILFILPVIPKLLSLRQSESRRADT